MIGKKELVELVERTPFSNENRAKVMAYINAGNNSTTDIQTNKSITYPTKRKKGDVFMNLAFKHPMVLLEYVGDGNWLAAMMTSKEECINNLCQGSSRFFGESFITKSLIMTSEEEKFPFMGVYDNNRHLGIVLKQLKNIFLCF